MIQEVKEARAQRDNTDSPKATHKTAQELMRPGSKEVED